MAENDTKKDGANLGQVRIPSDLSYEIDDEATRLSRLQNRRVHKYEVVERMWVAYKAAIKAIPNSGDAPIPKDSEDSRKVLPSSNGTTTPLDSMELDLTEVEKTWLVKLLRVRREFPDHAILIDRMIRVFDEGIKQAKDSLSQNIEYFELTVDAMRSFHGGTGNRIPDTGPEGDAGGSEELLTDTKAAGSSVEAALRSAGEVKRGTQQLVDARKPLEAPKRKNRKRSGSGE